MPATNPFSFVDRNPLRAAFGIYRDRNTVEAPPPDPERLRRRLAEIEAELKPIVAEIRREQREQTNLVLSHGLFPLVNFNAKFTAIQVALKQRTVNKLFALGQPLAEEGQEIQRLLSRLQGEVKMPPMWARDP